MSEECGKSSCSGCSESGCASRRIEKESLRAGSSVKRVIAVISGKGGVGKSTVTAMIAAALSAKGEKVGILDADITGPSIPRLFGVSDKAESDGECVYPRETGRGIKIMSINLLLEEETAPVIWRGPVISGTVKQFWTEVAWGELDTMLVDMPPGTGDVPLTVFQSIPVDGLIVVTTPQELVGMIVSKAVNMAQMMNVPVLGLVENMASFKCPDCGKIHEIFGHSNIAAIAESFGIGNVCRLAMDMDRAKQADLGKADDFETGELTAFINAL
ncbi:MAG: Mrp/NBP35 family ATP-binding protein [Lachnospiraceae bacterium]|nr:Mrp/NBP35 family ATP-binding protein [Lachnospiraceae bacterium]